MLRKKLWRQTVTTPLPVKQKQGNGLVILLTNDCGRHVT